MATETEIANAAAIRMGSGVRLTSLNDDKKAAKVMSEVWATERRATLREGSFNFSMKRVALAQLDLDAGEVIYPYSAAFGLPDGFLRLIEILDPVARTDYQLESGKILANVAGPLYARCIVDVPEMSFWDDAAAAAFALRLAWKCGRDIAGSSFDQDGCGAEYRACIAPAKHVDAMENPPIPQEESDWVLARGAYGWG
jgi:hypothetical protein